MDGSEIFAADLLAGRVALVTGGGTGLGRAAAAELRRCGAEVVICGRREDVLATTADELGLHHVAGDVRDPDDAERVIRFALERCGRLDALVNDAGGQYLTTAEAIEPKGWRAVTRLNVGETERMSRLAAEPAFRPAGGGTIVNVTLSRTTGSRG
jgi:citronellol/citronellal dehydrogenase